MSVVIETTIGDITIDLYLNDRPNTCLNFLKLCKIKYYNLCLFHKIEKNFIAQLGDPTGTGRGGESVFCQLYGDQAKYFESEVKPRLKHEKLGTISMVNNGNNMNGSQFFFTLGENLTYLDEVHTVFGEVVEGFNILLKLNEAICDGNNRPYQDIRITHTVVLHDPYEDPKGLNIPDASPEPTREQLESGYIAADEEIDDTKGRSIEEIDERIKESEAKARATILEMVGDIPDADVKPPENVLFVCKLNPVTTSEDLEIIFSRFGTIVSCEVIKDRKTSESLQYAFIEFEKEEDCENAYFKMDNVLIDDRRIHVDFSQSVSKMGWDADNKFSNVRLSKQNVVLKDKSKGTDGYDLIFDMNDDLQGDNDNKKNQKHRSKTPDNKYSHYSKNKKFEDKNTYRPRSPGLNKRRYEDKKEYSLSSDWPSSYKHRSNSNRNRSRSPNLDKKKQYEDVGKYSSSFDRQSSYRNQHDKDKSLRHKDHSSNLKNKSRDYNCKMNENLRHSPKRTYRDAKESRKSSTHNEFSRSRHRHDSVSPNREKQKSNDRPRRKTPSYDRSARTRDSNDSDRLKDDRRDKKCKSSHKESKRPKDLHSPPNIKHTSSKKMPRSKKVKKPKKRSPSSSVSSSSSSSSSPAVKKYMSNESDSSSSVEKISKKKYRQKTKLPAESHTQRKKHKKTKYP